MSDSGQRTQVKQMLYEFSWESLGKMCDACLSINWAAEESQQFKFAVAITGNKHTTCLPY